MILVGLLLSAMAAEKPSFSYVVKADDGGYAMRLAFVFSPDVTFSRAVANFRDDALIHELHSGSLPAESRGVGSGSLTYQKLTAFKTFGVKSAMLFECREEVARGRLEWRRRCDLDLTQLGADKLMTRKYDEVTCRQATPAAAVSCTLDVAGQIKDYLVFKSSKLTIRAKAQALTNWGRFWYFTETGSVSAELSNALFDRSEIARDVAGLLDAGLEAASRPTFVFEARKTFDSEIRADQAGR
ncbi:MAG: hypothetical protein HY075_04820 [Deltaproteobacteria bacterium]|nr:hypothetical protein [Deltaproteobacteria bacterium]